MLRADMDRARIKRLSEETVKEDKSSLLDNKATNKKIEQSAVTSDKPQTAASENNQSFGQ